jgi:hypothetical protein
MGYFITLATPPVPITASPGLDYYKHTDPPSYIILKLSLVEHIILT